MPIPEGEVVTEQLALLEALMRFGGRAALVMDVDHNLTQVVGDDKLFFQVGEGRVTGTGTAFLRPELQEAARDLFLLCRGDGDPVVGQ